MVKLLPKTLLMEAMDLTSQTRQTLLLQSQSILVLMIIQQPFQSSVKLSCLVTTTEEPLVSQQLRTLLSLPFQFILTRRTTTPQKDQMETREEEDLSSLSFKTTEMTNKSGRNKFIQVNQLIPSDLLIKPTIALLPTTHKISRETVTLLTLLLNTDKEVHALSGSLCKPEMPGTLLWLNKVCPLKAKSMPTWKDGVLQSLDGKKEEIMN